MLFSERRDHSPSKYLSTGQSTTNRHVSHGSVTSEMTFPVRQDAYTATDLTWKSTGHSSTISTTPSVPYPALAEGVGIRNRGSRTLTPADLQLSSPTSSTRSLGGGFFASIGRKASIRKDRPLPSTGTIKVIPASRPNKLQHPRVIKLDATPTIPGGPRAPAKPTQRVNNFLATKSQLQVPQDHSPSPNRSSIDSTGSFDRQLEKLTDLLPQADKDVLAVYLRKTPDHDPMLAINAYLENEKQGPN